MATAIHTLTRTLPAIVSDMATTRQRRAVLDADMYGSDPTRGQEQAMDELDARLDALTAEFDAAFYAATGVSWDLAEGVRS